MYVLKNVGKSFWINIRWVMLISCVIRSRMYKKAVWRWYKAIRGPADFSFGLLLLSTKNVYYLE